MAIDFPKFVVCVNCGVISCEHCGRDYDKVCDAYSNAPYIIKNLLEQINKMKCCTNCRKWYDGEAVQYDDTSYPCHQHNCDDVCPSWELKE